MVLEAVLGAYGFIGAISLPTHMRWFLSDDDPTRELFLWEFALGVAICLIAAALWPLGATAKGLKMAGNGSLMLLWQKLSRNKESIKIINQKKLEQLERETRY